MSEIPFAPIVQPSRRGDTIREQFELFDEVNPHVYQHLRRLALEVAARGTTRWGIGNLFEVLRWQSSVATTGDPYKLNNNFRSHYARKLMANEPMLEGMFEVRRLRSEDGVEP